MTKMIERMGKGRGSDIIGKTFGTVRKIAATLLVVCALVPSKVLVDSATVNDGTLELYADVDKCYAGGLQYFWDKEKYEVTFKAHDPLYFGSGMEDVIVVVYHQRSHNFGCNASGPPAMVQLVSDSASAPDTVTIQQIFKGPIKDLVKNTAFSRVVSPASLTVRRPYNIAECVVIVYSMISSTNPDIELLKENAGYTPLACGIMTSRESARVEFKKKLNKVLGPRGLKKAWHFILRQVLIAIEIILFLIMWCILFMILSCKLICCRDI